MCVHVVVKTLNLEISRFHLADYVKELYLGAFNLSDHCFLAGVVVAVAVVCALGLEGENFRSARAQNLKLVLVVVLVLQSEGRYLASGGGG